MLWLSSLKLWLNWLDWLCFNQIACRVTLIGLLSIAYCDIVLVRVTTAKICNNLQWVLCFSFFCRGTHLYLSIFLCRRFMHLWTNIEILVLTVNVSSLLNLFRILASCNKIMRPWHPDVLIIDKLRIRWMSVAHLLGDQLRDSIIALNSTQIASITTCLWAPRTR